MYSRCSGSHLSKHSRLLSWLGRYASLLSNSWGPRCSSCRAVRLVWWRDIWPVRGNGWARGGAASWCCRTTALTRHLRRSLDRQGKSRSRCRSSTMVINDYRKIDKVTSKSTSARLCLDNLPLNFIPLTAAGEPLLAYSLNSPIGIIEYHPELILLMLFRGYCDMQPNKNRLYIEGYHRYHSQI